MSENTAMDQSLIIKQNLLDRFEIQDQASSSKTVFVLSRSIEYNTAPSGTVTEILGVYDNVDALTDAIKVYSIKWDNVDIRIESLLSGYHEVGMTCAIGGSKENPDTVRYSITRFDLNVTDPEMVCEI